MSAISATVTFSNISLVCKASPLTRK